MSNELKFYHDEALTSYIKRLQRMYVLSDKDFKSLYNCTISNIRGSIKNKKLDQMMISLNVKLGVDHSILDLRFTRQLSTVRNKREKQLWNLFKSDDQVDYIGYYTNKLRICPKCIKEKGYIKLFWMDNLYLVCPDHGERLIDKCDKCGCLLTEDTCLDMKCSCGDDFREYSDVSIEKMHATRILIDIFNKNKSSDYPVVEYYLRQMYNFFRLLNETLLNNYKEDCLQDEDINILVDTLVDPLRVELCHTFSKIKEVGYYSSSLDFRIHYLDPVYMTKNKINHLQCSEEIYLKLIHEFYGEYEISIKNLVQSISFKEVLSHEWGYSGAKNDWMKYEVMFKHYTIRNESLYKKDFLDLLFIENYYFRTCKSIIFEEDDNFCSLDDFIYILCENRITISINDIGIILGNHLDYIKIQLTYQGVNIVFRRSLLKKYKSRMGHVDTFGIATSKITKAK